MTFAGNMVLILSALDSGVKYYRKPGGDIQDKKSHRFPSGFIFVALLSCRRIFVYTFCLINICLSLSDDANKIKTKNIERA